MLDAEAASTICGEPSPALGTPQSWDRRRITHHDSIQPDDSLLLFLRRGWTSFWCWFRLRLRSRRLRLWLRLGSRRLGLWLRLGSRRLRLRLRLGSGRLGLRSRFRSRYWRRLRRRCWRRCLHLRSRRRRRLRGRCLLRRCFHLRSGIRDRRWRWLRRGQVRGLRLRRRSWCRFGLLLRYRRCNYPRSSRWTLSWRYTSRLRSRSCGGLGLWRRRCLRSVKIWWS